MGGRSRDEELEIGRRELAAFVEHLAQVRRLSAHTVRAYEGDVDAYLAWCEREGLAPLSVSQRQVRRYAAQLVQARYADKTINRRLSSLRTYFRWLERNEVADASAVAAMPGRKLAKTLPKAMSDDEVGCLVATCDDSDEGLRDRALIELLYASGARISEAAGLSPGDVDYAQAQVHLLGKGSKDRIVPLYDVALRSVGAYERDVRPRLAVRRRKAGTCERLFVSTRGNDMSADALRRRFELHVREAGLAGGITPHAMRHTFATELLDGGADLKAVQELLGHEGLETTQIYTHLSIERLKQATLQAHPRG